MNSLSMKKEIVAKLDEAISKTTAALQTEGFGILTRIDFHSKINEKLGKTILPTVILGACNPQLAYEAYLRNAEVTSILPCNVVLREIHSGKISIELARPTALMEILGDAELVKLAIDADLRLQKVLEKI